MNLTNYKDTSVDATYTHTLGMGLYCKKSLENINFLALDS